MHRTNQAKHVMVVGKGYSGMLTSIHMARHAEKPMVLTMVERRSGGVAGGLAYSPDSATADQNTNIPIRFVSAFSDSLDDVMDYLMDPNTDRSKWPDSYRQRIEGLIASGKSLNENEAVPRVVYGMYFTARLEEAVAGNPNVRMETVNEEAVGVDITTKRRRVTFSDGHQMPANAVVLATGWTGNKQAPYMKGFEGHPRYIADQYTRDGIDTLASIAAAPGNGIGERTVVLGTGLSGYDAVRSLLTQGYQGEIIMLSRNGERHDHYPPTGPQAPITNYGVPSFRQVVDTLGLSPHNQGGEDAFVAVVKAYWDEFYDLWKSGHSPHAIHETFIPYIKEITGCFDPAYWGTFIQANSSLLTATRYGVGAEVTDPIYKAMATGQVKVVAGVIEKGGVTDSQDGDGTFSMHYRINGTTERHTIKVDHIISSLGREAVAGPIWDSLRQQGMMESHPTGIGIMVDEGGRLMRTGGNEAVPGLYATGVMRAGDSFMRNGYVGANLVNIPGMRDQARDTALTVLEDLGLRKYVDNGIPDPSNVVGGGTLARQQTARSRAGGGLS